MVESIGKVINDVAVNVAITLCSSGVLLALSYLLWNYRKRDVIVRYMITFFADEKSLFKRRMRRYVKPQFIAERFKFKQGTKYCESKQVISYNEVWKTIVNNNRTNRVLFIYAEAGMGKSLLLLHIVYRLMLRSGIKTNIEQVDTTSRHIFYKEFKHYTSIEELENDLRQAKNSGVRYVILDGFDEFKGLHYKESGEDSLQELFSIIDNEERKFSQVIISSRLDYLPHFEESILNSFKLTDTRKESNSKIKHIEVLKLAYFNKKQILDAYKNYVPSDFEQRKDYKRNKRHTLSLLKKYLYFDNDSIFRIPFFIRYSKDIFDSFNIEELKRLNKEQVLNGIIDHCVSNEFLMYKNFTGNVSRKTKEYEVEFEKYKSEVFSLLKQISMFMYIHKEVNGLPTTSNEIIEVDSNFNLNLTTINTRLFLVRRTNNTRNDFFEFQHRLFWEYFMVQNIGDMSYTDKRNILMEQNPNNNGKAMFENIIKLYTLLIVDRKDSDNILRSINSFKYKGKMVDHGDFLINNNIYNLVLAEKINVVDTPLLTIFKLINFFPLINELKYRGIILRLNEINEFVNRGYLDLCDQKGVVTLKGINNFGAIKCLDVLDVKLDDSDELEKCVIDEVLITVTETSVLERLLSLEGIKSYKIKIQADPKQSIQLYDILFEQIALGTNINVFDTINKSEITAIAEIIIDQIRNDTASNNKPSFDENHQFKFVSTPNILTYTDEIYVVGLELTPPHNRLKRLNITLKQTNWNGSERVETVFVDSGPSSVTFKNLQKNSQYTVKIMTLDGYCLLKDENVNTTAEPVHRHYYNTRIRETGQFSYEQHNNDYHKAFPCAEEYCEEDGFILRTFHRNWSVKKHNFDSNNICTECGYQSTLYKFNSLLINTLEHIFFIEHDCSEFVNTNTHSLWLAMLSEIKKSTYKSIEFFKVVILNRCESFGECHPVTLSAKFWFGVCHFYANMMEEASLIFREVISKRISLMKQGIAHLFVDFYYACTLRELGSYSEAKEILEYVLERQQDKLGENSIYTIYTQKNIGFCLTGLQDYTGAIKILTDSYHLEKEKVGDGSDVKKIARVIGDCYESVGDKSNANTWRKRARGERIPLRITCPEPKSNLVLYNQIRVSWEHDGDYNKFNLYLRDLVTEQTKIFHLEKHINNYVFDGCQPGHMYKLALKGILSDGKEEFASLEFTYAGR